MSGAVDTAHLAAVARSLLLDRAAGSAIEELRSAGIASILLKGAAIANWLYDTGEVRPYADVDLFVSPAEFERAAQVLASLGYVHWLAGAGPAEIGPKERELLGPDKVWIDLHLGFVGVMCPSQRCWDILSDRTAGFTLPTGVEVQVLDVPARTMHLALHAAQNGPIDVKAVADLQRGLDRVDRRHWREAAELAEEIEATQAFAAGLRLLPEGRVLAHELSLPRQMTVELALRVRSAPQTAIFLERLREAPGARKKLALVRHKLFPTTAYLRGAVTTERRRGLQLVGFWLSHTFSLVRGIAPALVAWRRAQQLVRDVPGADAGLPSGQSPCPEITGGRAARRPYRWSGATATIGRAGGLAPSDPENG